MKESKSGLEVYESGGQEIITQAQGLKIMDDESRAEASIFTSTVRQALKIIDDTLRPDIQSAHELHKSLLDKLKCLQSPYKTAQGIVDGEIKRDFMERERIRREEERRVAEAEAEKARLEEEANRKIEDRDIDGGLDTFEAAEKVYVPPAPPPVQKTVGSATIRMDIRVECTNLLLVARLVGNGALPVDFISVNTAVVKKWMKANGKKSLPGFKVTEVPVVTGRAR